MNGNISTQEKIYVNEDMNSFCNFIKRMYIALSNLH